MRSCSVKENTSTAALLIYGLLTMIILVMSAMLSVFLSTNLSIDNATSISLHTIHWSEQHSLCAIPSRIPTCQTIAKRHLSSDTLTATRHSLEHHPLLSIRRQSHAAEVRYDQFYLRLLIFPFLWFG